MPASLTERLTEWIRRDGPITFHDWMEAALYDPSGGYYQRSDRERWGRAGDYRTSPERSELFAATFARYFAKLYDQLEQPEEWTIVEGGAGNGEFAAVVLRTLADHFPTVFDATRYVVSELSESARQTAHERLVDFGERVQFHSDLPEVKRGIYFSNELLDAFPVHRVVKDRGELRESYVTVGDNGFEWTTGRLASERISEFCNEYSIDLAEGQVIEINLEIDEWLKQIAAKLERGFVITIDYGADATDLFQRPEGTLRGFKRHGFVADILAQPGDCDITTTINWTQVRKVGEKLGLKTVEFNSQDKFLIDAGLLEEMELRLKRCATDAEKLALSTGAREMILPGGMASSFQVMVQQKGTPDVA